MTTTIALCLDPLDVLFFRDGRPFGTAGQGRSGLPLPQTLAGALRTAVLERYCCDFDRLGRAIRDGMRFRDACKEAGVPDWIPLLRVRGPWLARRTKDAASCSDIFLPMPAILQEQKRKWPEEALPIHRLAPLASKDKLPGWRPPAPGMRPLWSTVTERCAPLGGFLNLEGIKVFLSGGVPKAEHVASAADLFDYDERTGIGVNPERLSAEEGLIYSASYLALKRGICFYSEVAAPPEAPEDLLRGIATLAFGGEGRKVRLGAVSPVNWPVLIPTPKGKALLLLTTPGIFQSGWLPRSLEGRLTSAAVPGHAPISGWDLGKGGPKPTRFATQAGSVYFLNEPMNTLDEILAETEDDSLQGYGCNLKGVWIDE